MRTNNRTISYPIEQILGGARNKPDWEDAPEWAMFLAQDDDGWYSWWNISPERNPDGTWSQGKPMGDYTYLECGYGCLPEGFSPVLEPRP